MNNKLKIFSLILALNTIAFSAKVDKNNSELMVSGDGVKERVDYTLYAKELGNEDNHTPGKEEIVNKTHNGNINGVHAVYAEKGATVQNIGKITSYNESLKTDLGGAVIMGIVNPLKRDDVLVALRGNPTNSLVKTTFINDGIVNMGSMYQDISVGNIAGLIPTSLDYADYTKNIIDAENTDIINNGTITNERDKITYSKYFDIGILNGFRINYRKNAVNISNGSIKNKGTIEYNRDEKFTLTNGIAVDLLQIGVFYNRDKSVINSVGSTIENSGKIFMGGDILTKGKYSGIGVSAIGADLTGTHEKYGINATKGKVINTGVIEVERDFTKALDDNNNILDLYLIYHNLLKLGLLSFTNLTETSIGVNINNGEYYNNGGTISVGVNQSKKFATQLRKGAGIAVAGNNNSTIYFNTKDDSQKTPILNTIDKDGKEVEVKSIINLEGLNVYATFLENNSTATFKGTTEINFKHLPNLDEEEIKEYNEKRNKHIFYTDDSSEVKIQGKVIANGDIDIGDYTIGKENHHDKITIEAGYEAKKDSNGNIIGFDKKETAIISTGKIGLDGNIKFDTTNFIGMSTDDINKSLNHEYIKADGGIEGNGNLVSNSYLFDIETNKTDNSISLTDVNRKDFNSIVENEELGNLLESNYNSSLGEKMDFYKYLALGEDYNSFSKKLNEISGIDNITTLETQVIDITKDLNKQYRNFTKANQNDGIVFSYLNSKSEINETEKYAGFKRKSNGIMTGYNKNISDKERVGIGFSYMKSDIDYTSDSSNKIETWNMRGYSDYKFKNINILNDLSFGYNKSENKRYVDDKLNSGDVNTYTLGLNNSIYKDYKITDKLMVTPSINLDFIYYYQDDYEEGKEKFSVNADKTDGFYTTLGVGTEFKYDILSYRDSKISLIGGIDYSYDILNRDSEIDLVINNLGKFSEEKREIDKDALSYSFGINYDYNEFYSGQIKYTKELINDVDNEKISIDFSYKF